MAQSEVLQNFTSVLFCFHCDAAQFEESEFNRPFTKQNGKVTQLWRADPLHAYHLAASTAALLGLGVQPGTIGQVYALDDAVRRDLEFPEPRTVIQFSCRGREQPSTVLLQRVRLALFKTGVGILELCFSCGSADSRELLDVNYFLTEVKSDANVLHFEMHAGRDDIRTVETGLLTMVKKLLSPFAGAEDFDTVPGLHYVDSKPLVFSYLLFENFPDDLGRQMFNLRTNFKSSYQMPAEEYELSAAHGVFHPFENLYWGTSLSGVVCCASLTQDEKANTFFRETFFHNLRETYLQLYFLRLHQRYGILNFQRQFVGADEGLSTDDPEKVRAAYRNICALQQRVISFKLKCLYQEPSSVEHINRYDAFLAENMHIAQSFASFEEGVRQLNAVATAVKEKLDAREDEQHRLESLRRERLLYIFTAMWSIVVFFESAWKLVEHFVGHDIWFGSLWMIIPAAAALLPAANILLELQKKTREIRRIESRRAEGPRS